MPLSSSGLTIFLKVLSSCLFKLFSVLFSMLSKVFKLLDKFKVLDLIVVPIAVFVVDMVAIGD